MKFTLTTLAVLFNLFLQAQFNWEKTTLPVSQTRYDDCYFIGNMGWAIDYGSSKGKVYRTEDGGSTWYEPSQLSITTLRCINFPDPANGFLGRLGKTTEADSFIMYHTIDSGNTWQPVETFPIKGKDKGVCGMFSLDDSVIYACGRYWGPANFYRSLDKGVTWSSFSLDSIAFGLVDCHFWSKDSGIIVGSYCSIGIQNPSYQNAAVFKTVDGGNSWRRVYATVPNNEWCWKISSPVKGVFYVSIEQWNNRPLVILKSVDYGESWNEMLVDSSPASYAFLEMQGIGFINETEGWVSGHFKNQRVGKTYHTINGGLTWAEDSTLAYTNRFRFFGDTLAFASGRYMYSYKNGAVVNRQVEPEPDQPFEVLPNYSTHRLTVRLKPGADIKEISIYSLDGRGIKTYKPDRDVLDIDISNWQPGLYFVTAPGGSSAARNFIKL